MNIPFYLKKDAPPPVPSFIFSSDNDLEPLLPLPSEVDPPSKRRAKSMGFGPCTRNPVILITAFLRTTSSASMSIMRCKMVSILFNSPESETPRKLPRFPPFGPNTGEVGGDAIVPLRAIFSSANWRLASRN